MERVAGVLGFCRWCRYGLLCGAVPCILDLNRVLAISLCNSEIFAANIILFFGKPFLAFETAKAFANAERPRGCDAENFFSKTMWDWVIQNEK